MLLYEPIGSEIMLKTGDIVIEKQSALLKLMFKKFQLKLMAKVQINTFALNVLRHLKSLNNT